MEMGLRLVTALYSWRWKFRKTALPDHWCLAMEVPEQGRRGWIWGCGNGSSDGGRWTQPLTRDSVIVVVVWEGGEAVKVVMAAAKPIMWVVVSQR